MKKAISVGAFLFLIWIGIFDDIIVFSAWLIMLNYNWADVSIVGEIIVRLLSFGISYSLVGSLFWCFGGKIKSLAYHIISSLVGFALSWIIWKIEQNLVAIIIVFSSIVLVATAIFIICYLIRNKRQKANHNEKEELNE